MSAIEGGETRPHVRFATPSYSGKPCGQYLESLAATDKLCRAAGFLTSWEMLAGDCYVQRARNVLVANALAAGATHVFFLDDDLGWAPEAALKLLHMADPIVFGAYPFKDKEGFPIVVHCDAHGYPHVRDDGCIAAAGAPTGFLRIAAAVFGALHANRPDLEYDEFDEKGAIARTLVDFFPQGVAQRRWWGEDFAFSNLAASAGLPIWCVPDIDFAHVARDGRATHGNYHRYLMERPRHDQVA